MPFKNCCHVLIIQYAKNFRRSLSYRLYLAGTEGADSNTSSLQFEVTESLIQELIELAHKLRRLGVYEVDGKLFYDEDGL